MQAADPAEVELDDPVAVLAAGRVRDDAPVGRHVVPAKSRLQEVIQRDYHCGPEYKLEGEAGPAHSPTFTSVVLVEGRRVGRGTGSTKKESQANAAADALRRMGYEAGDDAPEGSSSCI